MRETLGPARRSIGAKDDDPRKDDEVSHNVAFPHLRLSLLRLPAGRWKEDQHQDRWRPVVSAVLTSLVSQILVFYLACHGHGHLKKKVARA